MREISEKIKEEINNSQLTEKKGPKKEEEEEEQKEEENNSPLTIETDQYYQDHMIILNLKEFTNFSKEITSHIVDLIHSSCANLIQKRNLNNMKISISQFVSFSNRVLSFIDLTEQIAEKSCFTLRYGLLNQSKEYIIAFHDKQSQTISLLLDNEVTFFFYFIYFILFFLLFLFYLILYLFYLFLLFLYIYFKFYFIFINFLLFFYLFFYF